MMYSHPLKKLNVSVAPGKTLATGCAQRMCYVIIVNFLLPINGMDKNFKFNPIRAFAMDCPKGLMTPIVVSEALTYSV